jgi:hypothetical protein
MNDGCTISNSVSPSRNGYHRDVTGDTKMRDKFPYHGRNPDCGCVDAIGLSSALGSRSCTDERPGLDDILTLVRRVSDAGAVAALLGAGVSGARKSQRFQHERVDARHGRSHRNPNRPPAGRQSARPAPAAKSRRAVAAGRNRRRVARHMLRPRRPRSNRNVNRRRSTMLRYEAPIPIAAISCANTTTGAASTMPSEPISRTARRRKCSS